jgi:branched-chain amino acid transport system substrate-binding protein
MICSCSGAQAANLGPTGNVAEAWAKSVNARGGINGYPVKLIVKDDGGNPATSQLDAKTLVEQDHAIAIVGETSLADASWANYVASKGIPVVGGIVAEPTFQTDPDFFASGTQIIVGVIGNLAEAKVAGKTHFGVEYCAESPVCAQIIPIASAASKLLGLQFSAAKISATVPSFAAPCLSAKQAGVDAMFVVDNAVVEQRLVDGCAQLGYKPRIIANIETSSKAWLSDPNFDGTLLDGPNADPSDTSIPAIQQFQSALDRFTPGIANGSEFTFDAIFPWVGGKLFEAAAKAAKLTPKSTGADVKKGLYALKSETLGGISPPLSFPVGKPALVPCYYTAKLTGGKFTAQNNDQPSCLSAAQSKALAALLK